MLSVRISEFHIHIPGIRKNYSLCWELINVFLFDSAVSRLSFIIVYFKDLGPQSLILGKSILGLESEYWHQICTILLRTQVMVWPGVTSAWTHVSACNCACNAILCSIYIMFICQDSRAIKLGPANIWSILLIKGIYSRKVRLIWEVGLCKFYGVTWVY